MTEVFSIYGLEILVDAFGRQKTYVKHSDSSFGENSGIQHGYLNMDNLSILKSLIVSEGNAKAFVGIDRREREVNGFFVAEAAKVFHDRKPCTASRLYHDLRSSSLSQVSEDLIVELL